jgi:hypothetical protein
MCLTGLTFSTVDTLVNGTSCVSNSQFSIGLVRDSDWCGMHMHTRTTQRLTHRPMRDGGACRGSNLTWDAVTALNAAGQLLPLSLFNFTTASLSTFRHVDVV